MQTIQYLDAVKARYGLTSDYKLAKLLGVSRSRVSLYRNGKHSMGDEVAIRVAELLELQPGEVLSDLQAERTKDPAVRRVWEQLARQLHAAAFAFVFVGLAVGFGLDSTPSYAASVTADSVYYVKLAGSLALAGFWVFAALLARSRKYAHFSHFSILPRLA